MKSVSSVAQLCQTLCDPMDCSTPGFSVHHQLLECIQTHVHWIGDAIGSSYPPAFNLSQHQGLFQWISCSHQVAKVLELQLQHQSFQRVFRVDEPWDWLVWSPCFSRDFQESSPVPQFRGISALVLCLLYRPALRTVRDHWKNHSLDYTELCQQSNVSAFQHTV